MVKIEIKNQAMIKTEFRDIETGHPFVIIETPYIKTSYGSAFNLRSAKTERVLPEMRCIAVQDMKIKTSYPGQA